ncbi:MAG: serine protease, partial [Rhodopirellula sp. JB044]
MNPDSSLRSTLADRVVGDGINRRRSVGLAMPRHSIVALMFLLAMSPSLVGQDTFFPNGPIPNGNVIPQTYPPGTVLPGDVVRGQIGGNVIEGTIVDGGARPGTGNSTRSFAQERNDFRSTIVVSQGADFSRPGGPRPK